MPRARFAWIAGLSLLGAMALGVALRGFLAGIPLPAGDYKLLRHAHSHLGYFGILFPLAWWAWAGLGVPVPGPRTTAVYAVATLAGTVGFAVAGYGPLAIVGSTAVLAVWLASAWTLRRRVLAHRDWLAGAPPAIVLSAVAIPGVALNIDRDPDLARELVQGFLALLLLGVIVPTALAVGRAPRPHAPLWTLAMLGAALALGPLPSLPTHLCLALLGAMVAVGGWRSAAPLDIRLLWVGLGVGLLLLGTRLLPEHHPVAIAGLHYVILGPVLLTLARPLLPALPGPVRVGYALLVVVFTTTVGAQAWWMPPALLRTAAALGAAVALAWTGAILLAARARRPAPPALRRADGRRRGHDPQ